jgi:hypothetical protein
LFCFCYKGWSRGNACFSYENNFVYFQHKKVLITQKRRYFNAFLKYVQNYVVVVVGAAAAAAAAVVVIQILLLHR